ncbi:hypothetical protein WJX73_008318 [Symbiochloris irregularis]|uniref:Aspartate/glutamate/uridylate kinase domain-containing protein n=1 Tax=Symbiochloris irregularis TaxID=706552 RepID=A0AAW1PVS1_9CHLO
MLQPQLKAAFPREKAALPMTGMHHGDLQDWSISSGHFPSGSEGVNMPSAAMSIPNGRAINDCVNFDQHSSPDMAAFKLDSQLSAVQEDQIQEYKEAEKRGTMMGTPEASPAFHTQSKRSPVSRTFSGSMAGVPAYSSFADLAKSFQAGADDSQVADATRIPVKNARRVVVKVGTAVVTRGTDSRLALGRLGALVEQLEALIQGHTDVSSRAAAAAGQSGLMALYDSLFSMMDLQAAQVLVTSNDFTDPHFKNNLCATVEDLLSMNVVPVFNENDAISKGAVQTKENSPKVPFWDNDSLAALLAIELNADLLMLMTDVNGLYTGAPSDPSSK